MTRSHLFPPFPHLRRTLVGLALLLWSFALPAQEPSYAGRPFVRIATTGGVDPVAGSITAFGRAQVLGSTVTFVTLSGPQASGVYEGRGGVLTRVLDRTTPLEGVLPGSFHDAFARDTGTGREFVIPAGTGATADSLYTFDGTTFRRSMGPSFTLPNSGGKPANVLGEPYLAQGRVAVIAWHALPAGGGVDFRGVYRILEGAPVPVSDTATALPAIGVPTAYSSQVGFDGTTLAFWAARGPFTEEEGMFVQAGPGQAVVAIARNGDAFPDGGVIDGFISPPVVSEGAVYFFAFDAGSQARLLRYAGGVLTVLARDGQAVPGGGTLAGLGQYGLGVENSRVFFPARTPTAPGVFVLDQGELRTVVAPGAALGGIQPVSIVLQDVAGDTLVLESASVAVRRLVANLAVPAVPVIVEQPQPTTVADGARATLSVRVIGDEPLAYTWYFLGQPVAGAVGATLEIPAAGALQVGQYSVQITNAAGRVTSAQALLNVQAAPVVVLGPADVTVEAGDSLLFSLDVRGGLPWGMIWSRDGVPVANEATFSGQFLRRNAQLTDAGVYSVLITNAWGEARSGTARVTVSPPPPNPVYGGAALGPILDSTTSLADLGPIGASLTEFSAVWRGGQVVVVAQGPGSVPVGLAVWSGGGLTLPLPATVPLPHGLGAGFGFQLVISPGTVAGDAPLVLRGQRAVNGFPEPTGFYAWSGTDLQVIADVTLPVPGETGVLFPPFYGEAVQVGGQVVFSSTISNVPGLFLGDTGGVRRVLTGRDDLPVVGTTARQFQSPAFDGQRWAVVAAGPAQNPMVLLRGDETGAVTRVLAKGDPLPGTSSSVSLIGSVSMEAGTIWARVFDGSFAAHLVRVRDGVVERLAGPGMPVAGGGTLQSIDSSFLKVADGRVFFTGRVSLNRVNLTGVLSVTDLGIEPTLLPRKLDGRGVRATYLMDVDGTRVSALVDFSDGTRSVYANVVTSQPELRLPFVREQTAVKFTVPAGAILEGRGSVTGGLWEAVPAGAEGEVRVPVAETARFFRLRRP